MGLCLEEEIQKLPGCSIWIQKQSGIVPLADLDIDGWLYTVQPADIYVIGLSTDRQRTGTVSARVEKRRKKGSSVVCYAAPMLSAHNLQWILTISCVALMLARGTSIHKSFVVPLFALQAPLGIVSWMKGEYGIWAALLALLTRLFFSFPGELELPFIALLLVIVAPYQVMSIRGKQEGAILSLALSCFLAFQHFSRAGSLQKAFDQNSVLATVAIIGVTVVSFLFLV